MARKRGITYPLTIVNGQLGYSEDLALVEEHIISVLETRPYERVMRATYGFDPKIFDTMEPNAINARIYKAVTEEVSEVEDLDVRGQIDGREEGLYQVTLYYKVRGVPAPPLTLSLNM